MWGWVMRMFGSNYEPLERPAPLTGACGGSLDAPDMQPVRDIQHDADNVITGARGWQAVRRLRADAFNAGLRDAWKGPTAQ